MSRPLQPELIQALQLEQNGFEHPEGVLVALEAAQEEICLDTGLEPGQVFSVGNCIMQCYYLPNRIINLNDQTGTRLLHGLLHYSASDRYADRIIQFNYHSGYNMATTSTYENCPINVDAVAVPCFSIAELSLNAQGPSLSVIFARVY